MQGVDVGVYVAGSGCTDAAVPVVAVPEPAVAVSVLQHCRCVYWQHVSASVDVAIGGHVTSCGCAGVVVLGVCVYIASGGCASCCGTGEVYWRHVHKLACVMSVVS